MASWFDPLKRRAVLWNRRRLHHRMQARMTTYATWCERYDTLGPDTLSALQQRLAQLPARLHSPPEGAALDLPYRLTLERDPTLIHADLPFSGVSRKQEGPVFAGLALRDLREIAR